MRPSWDDFFAGLAEYYSTMATCSRRKVGAVVARDKLVLGLGFNGVAAGKKHCTEGGCPRGLMGPEVPPGADYNLYPCKAIHAEANAIYMAGIGKCVDATIYVTEEPCQQCLNLIERENIGRIVVYRPGD